MAGVKITALPPGGTIQSNDLFPIARNNNTFNVRGDAIFPIIETRLDTNSVSNRALSANVVSLDKIRQIPGNRVLGNNTASQGNVVSVQVSEGMIADDAVTSVKIKELEVKTGNIADDAVTYPKMQNVVTANRVLGSTIDNGVVTETQVLENMIADDAVTSLKIKEKEVKEGNINDDAVTTSKIKNNNVTFGKIQQIGSLTNRVIGYTTANTNAQALQITQSMLDSNFGLVPKGGIIMWSGSIATIPGGWALCDGSNNTPDLRDRFIVGATSDFNNESRTNITGSLTKIGGSASSTFTLSRTVNVGVGVTLSNISATATGGSVGDTTLTIAQIPSHSHGGVTGSDSPDHTHTMFMEGGYGDGGSQNFWTPDFWGDSPPSGSTNIRTSGASTRHTHTIAAQGGGGSHGHTFSPPTITISQPTVNVSVTQPEFSVSGNATGNNLPPYYALAFIMKL